MLQLILRRALHLQRQSSHKVPGRKHLATPHAGPEEWSLKSHWLLEHCLQMKLCTLTGEYKELQATGNCGTPVCTTCLWGVCTAPKSWSPTCALRFQRLRGSSCDRFRGHFTAASERVDELGGGMLRPNNMFVAAASDLLKRPSRGGPVSCQRCKPLDRVGSPLKSTQHGRPCSMGSTGQSAKVDASPLACPTKGEGPDLAKICSRAGS